MRVSLVVIALAVAAAAAHAASAAPQNDRSVSGTVLDSQGLPVVGARIEISQSGGDLDRAGTSTAQGFQMQQLPAGLYQVRVSAEGFEPQTVTADLRGASSQSLEFILRPARLAEDVIVVANRTEQRIGDVAASVRIVPAEEVRNSPAAAVDDVLRQVPTFSLFRRTSSLAAHPTAQGVSLRGIGPSGVSRTLVMVDDIPFNDPFGGWVYWTRVPMAGLNRIEMVDGTTSSVYGNYALGGVVNFVSDRPTPRTLILQPRYGGRNNSDPSGREVWDGLGALDFYASDVRGDFGASVEGSIFGTNGYPTVHDDVRGPVDTKATVDYRNFNVKIDYSPSDRLSAFVRGGYFWEDRDNAKVCLNSVTPGCSETNDTVWKSLNGGIRVVLPDQSHLQVSVFGNFKEFHSNFLAVPDASTTRASARLSLRQTVPNNDTGFLTQWSKALGSRHYITLGADWHWVDGDSKETVFSSSTGNPVVNRILGGTQQSLGVYLQDVITVTSQFQVTLSGRLDRWRNYDGHSASDPNLPEKKNTVGSPRVGARYEATNEVTLWGSLGWGFRAPTLNELYRGFRVGTVVTDPNFNLGPERLVDTEFGVEVTPVENLTWRTTGFHNRITNPVSNVTVDVGALITRQRQNLGRVRVWGIQSDVEYRVGPYWMFSATYLYNVARIKEFDAAPELVDHFLPQVPMHRGAVTATYSDPRVATFSVQALFSGGQYDDDQNLNWLPYFGTVDFNVRRGVSENLDVFFGVQNLFNREFIVQRNPTTVGAPRLVSGGLRISFGRQ